MEREEAILFIKELLVDCRGLDDHPLTLTSPHLSGAPSGGYQVIIGGALGKETRQGIETMAAQHQLACQTGSLWRTRRSINKGPDTLVIYKPKKP